MVLLLLTLVKTPRYSVTPSHIISPVTKQQKQQQQLNKKGEKISLLLGLVVGKRYNIGELLISFSSNTHTHTHTHTNTRSHARTHTKHGSIEPRKERSFLGLLSCFQNPTKKKTRTINHSDDRNRNRHPGRHKHNRKVQG